MAQLQLPISVGDALAQIVNPALDRLPIFMTSDQARVMMLAIALQESGLAARVQDGGPAHGLWQFEQGGGVRGVLKNVRSAHYAQDLCNASGVTPLENAAYEALAGNDILAAGFARLLLWTDSAPLPSLGDQAGALSCYRRNWRPGAFAPGRWPGAYKQALGALA